MNAFDIAIDYNTLLGSGNADVLIAPKFSNVSLADSGNSYALFDEGYKAALVSMPEIKNALQAKRVKAKKSLIPVASKT
jgi:hypothetical protein